MRLLLNCDLGEGSDVDPAYHDEQIMPFIDQVNIACGIHAGDPNVMNRVIKTAKKYNVSIGAHPSFNDPENFGRKRINISPSEIKKLIIDQYEILQKIAQDHEEHVTHMKPHGALNNMACEDIELATILALSLIHI